MHLMFCYWFLSNFWTSNFYENPETYWCEILYFSSLNITPPPYLDDIYSLFQEYPPGVIIVPMKSRTAKPFHTTNLVIFAPKSVKNESEDYNFVAHGDALIVDPGCRADFHEEVRLLATGSEACVVHMSSF